MIKTIIFDCWGTLFTSSLQPHPFEVFADRLGHSIRDYKYLKTFESCFMLEAYADLNEPIVALLGQLNIEANEQLVHELKDVMLTSTANIIAYPDVLEGLSSLKSEYELILLSNTFKQGFDSLDDEFHITEIFDKVYASFETHRMKPNEDLLKEIVDMSSSKISEIVVVGDNLQDDIVPARNLGLRAVLLDRRDRYPDVVQDKIMSLNELDKYLR